MVLFLLYGAFFAVVAIGHFGFWIWLFNRVNATGLKRKTIKRIEKTIVLACACGLIPIGLLLLELRSHDATNALEYGSFGNNPLAFFAMIYALGAGFFAVAATPFWILDRPPFAIAADRYQILESEDLSQLQHPASNAALYIEGRRFRQMAKLPGNQIVSLQRNRKRLFIDRLPRDLENLQIAHLSDVHLTGQLSTSFYRLAMDWIFNQSPDMIVLSGDIVDYQESLKQMRSVFDGLSAPLGCYFILGNHDKRLTVPTDVCTELCAMGWTDVGKSSAVAAKTGFLIHISGNERPWFERHNSAAEIISGSQPQKHQWKLGVAHSPDQFDWGIANRFDLLLCGHTHGGQIRLPVIGPVITPSRYGSRYASGVFWKKNTLMHVSRGISGVHPFRWGCIPEVTILELAARTDTKTLEH